MPTRLLPLALLLIAPVAAWAADDKTSARPDPAAVRALVEDLKSKDFKTRERATEELSKLEVVPAELREATKSDDLEVRCRAERAVAAITARAEDRAFKAMVADLGKLELDRFVRRMATDAEFAGGKQWQLIQTLTRAVVGKANELAGRKFEVPDPDMKSLPAGGEADRVSVSGKRLRLAAPTKFTTVDGCVILSTGPMAGVTSLRNTIVISDGDFSGATVVENCVLIVRGRIGPMTGVRNSIILTTGEFTRATTIQGSFFQVGSAKLKFTSSRDSVYVNSEPANARSDTNGKTLTTERGPLQLLRFSDGKREPPMAEREPPMAEREPPMAEKP